MKTIVVSDDFYAKVCKRFGERLKEARESAGMTQREFTEDLGYKSNASVSKWEAGQGMPRIRTLFHIARWMGLSLDWLYSFSDEKYNADHIVKHRRSTG